MVVCKRPLVVDSPIKVHSLIIFVTVFIAHVPPGDFSPAARNVPLRVECITKLDEKLHSQKCTAWPGLPYSCQLQH